MPINTEMLHAQSPDDVAALKARIAELERMDTEHTVQIAKMNGYISVLEEERDRWKNEAKRQENLAAQNWDYHKRMEKEWLRCNNAYIRALWLARAKRAEKEKNYWYVRSCHEGDEIKYAIDGSSVTIIGMDDRKFLTPYEWLKTWCEIEIRLTKKAEEY